MGCFTAPEIGEALKRFVDKDEKLSIHDTFDHILKNTKKAALEDLATAGEPAMCHSVPEAHPTSHGLPCHLMQYFQQSRLAKCSVSRS